MATTGSASAEPSAGDWAKLRNCESGGNYAINTGNGYYGAYQFDQSTWRSVGGSGLPSDASPATQDALAYKLWQQRGWSPWACASIVGLPEGGSGGPAVAAPVAPVVKKPAVSFDAARVSGNARSLTVNGWAVDGKSTAASIKVQVTVDGKVTTVAANRARPDVNRVRKISGQHGFAVTLPISAGSHKVCVTAVGTSGNTSAGCRTVVVPQQPTAHLDAVQVVHGRVIVKGWAYDPNAAGQSTKVAVVLNGQLHIAVANQSSGDVNRVNGINGRHRFTASLPLRFGSNKVCITAWGTSSARTLSLGCAATSLGKPDGSIDKVTVTGRTARVVGWAFDPNAKSTSVRVVIDVNGVRRAFSTNGLRADVNRLFGLTGKHSYNALVPLRKGNNKVCLTAMGSAGIHAVALGCRTVKA